MIGSARTRGATGTSYRRYNDTPQPELFGLSPTQIAQLFRGDWRTVGAVRLNPGLGLDQAGRAWAFRAALQFLALLRDRGPAPATATGNLSRKFVSLALEIIEFPAEELEVITRYSKVINEPDAGLLLELRQAVVAAGWVRRHRGFRITSLGRDALDRARSSPGEFFLRLFLARMGVTGRWLDQEGLVFQSALGPALFLFAQRAAEWIDSLDVTESLLISSLLPTTPPEELPHYAYQWVLAPCLDFGLVERRAGARILDPSVVRITPLFGDFVTFRFEPDP